MLLITPPPTLAVAAAARQVPAAADFFQEAETCVCLNEMCLATIPSSHVAKRIDPRTGRQEVKARCPHCRTEYAATRVLSGNRWQAITFGVTPAPGFEHAGGTPPPTLDDLPCDHRLAREDDGSYRCRGCDRVGDAVDGVIVWREETPAPSSVVTPAEQAALDDRPNDQAAKLRQACDVAGVVADAGVEFTLDTSTSQL